VVGVIEGEGGVAGVLEDVGGGLDCCGGGGYCGGKIGELDGGGVG
jgi:hypothetical protein